MGPPVWIPDRFNAARFSVDRHVEQGRGDHVALIAGGSSATCRGPGRSVKRVGNALLAPERAERNAGLISQSRRGPAASPGCSG